MNINNEETPAEEEFKSSAAFTEFEKLLPEASKKKAPEAGMVEGIFGFAGAIGVLFVFGVVIFAIIKWAFGIVF